MTVQSEWRTAMVESECALVLEGKRQPYVRVDHVSRALVRAVDEYLVQFEYRSQCIQGGLSLKSLDPLVHLYGAFVRADPQRICELFALLNHNWRMMSALYGVAPSSRETAPPEAIEELRLARAAHASAVSDLRRALTVGSRRAGPKILLAGCLRRLWRQVEHGFRRRG